MFERRITVEDVLETVRAGETIEEYPSDMPLPSRLLLGWIGSRPLHVVAAHDPQTGNRIIITAYEPEFGSMGARFSKEEVDEVRNLPEWRDATR
ncbi:MAG TPA: DUF4258 domain-containing protein [Thermoanaerobaculia bacterium]